jgi:hypothetical protein
MLVVRPGIADQQGAAVAVECVGRPMPPVSFPRGIRSNAEAGMPSSMLKAIPSADALSPPAVPTAGGPSHLLADPLVRAGGAMPPFSSGESSARPWHRYLASISGTLPPGRRS